MLSNNANDLSKSKTETRLTWLQLTMHRTVGLTDYYRTISGGVDYLTNRLSDWE